MVFKCCVNGCKYQGTSGLHQFPTNEDFAKKWTQLSKAKQPHLCNHPLAVKKFSHSFYRICHKHFEPHAYKTNENGERRLLKTALPTLFLPDDLLRIKREHDYGLDARMEVKPRQPLKIMIINSKKYPRNENMLDKDNNSHSVFFAAASSVDVGAEVVLNEKNQFVKSQEFSKVIRNDTDELTYYKTRCEELEKRCQELEKKYEKAEKKYKELEHKSNENKWNDDNVVKYLSNKFNKQQLELFKMQIYNACKPLHGRSYSPDQKSLTLAMYKKSPKKYRFLRRFLILPGYSTLARHCAKLTFQSGIDTKLMNIMKAKVKDLPEVDKYCVLTWDETAITAHLDFSKKRDVIDGFVEVNGSRRPEFATHALTFMTRGINTPYKEPVSYNYTAGLTSNELVETVKLTNEAVFKTGLKPIMSVCDQPGVNAATVHKLIDPKCKRKTPDGKLLEYKVHGRINRHMYDIPHLIKVTRTNLQTKDLQHRLDKAWKSPDSKYVRSQRPKYASWDHVGQLYDLDCQTTVRRLLKITKEHIKPEKEKMTVSVATQVFSRTVGNLMLDFSQTEQLPVNFAETAYVLLFFNDLFDSLNTSGSAQSNGLKGPVNEGSIHFAFWEYALSVLTDMNFVNKSDKTTNNDSTVLKKWESTIRGYMQISKMCLELGMTDIALRNTNQDGLENFFCQCKGVSGSSKPTAFQFRPAYTTMIVNNLTGPTSAGSNCEEDKFIALLSNINELILDTDETSQENTELSKNDIKENEIDMLEMIVFDPLFGEEEFNNIEDESLSDSSIAVCRKLLKITKCDNCKSSLQEPTTYPQDELNVFFPSQTFKTDFERIFCGLNAVIPHLCSEYSVSKKIIQQIESIQVSLIGCQDHCDEMGIKFKELTTDYALKRFCNNINQILSNKTSVLPTDPNVIQQKALVFQRKKKHIGKFSDIFIKN